MGIAALLPGLHRLRHYDRAWLRGDVLGGVTVAAYLVPQCMAYAELAGVQPVAGLWAIIPALALYALIGSSPQLSAGPESTTAVMTATAVAPLAAADPASYPALAAMLAILVGGVCVLARLFRLGFLADLLSRPILVGYMAGVAVIMVVSQLGKLTGVPVEGDDPLEEVRSFLGSLGEADPATVALAALVLAFLFAVAHWRPRWPGPLLAVLLSTAAVVVFDLTARGVAVVGDIPAGIPVPGLPGVDGGEIVSLLAPALGIALVGYSDNVLTARAFAARNGYTVDANQELLALGAANAGSGLMQGFPVSSSGSRTVLGDAMGTRSQLFSLVAAAAVVVVLLFFRPVLAEFPSAALGAIVVYAAVRLVDITGFRRLFSFRPTEFALALATTVGVLVFDILYGVLVAIALSVLELLARVARPPSAVLGRVPGLAGLHDVADWEGAVTVPGLVVFRYDAPLFFANAENLRTQVVGVLDAQDARVEWLVLNVEATVEIDATAADALDGLCDELDRRGVRLGLARMKQDLRDQLARTGLLERIGADMIFPTLPTALEA